MRDACAVVTEEQAGLAAAADSCEDRTGPDAESLQADPVATTVRLITAMIRGLNAPRRERPRMVPMVIGPRVHQCHGVRVNVVDTL
jgi:hypothetical protein